MTRAGYLLTLAGIAVVLFLAVGGCASTAPYLRFAQAGTAYTEALDDLLQYAGVLSVDYTSYQLLADHENTIAKIQRARGRLRLAPANEQERIQREIADYSEDSIRAFQVATKDNTDRLDLLAHLRTHTHQLARYFQLLAETSNPDGSKDLRDQLENAVDKAVTFGKAIRLNKLFSETDKKAVSGLTEIFVGQFVSTLLKREFSEERVRKIRAELKTQELLLATLALRIEVESIGLGNYRGAQLIEDAYRSEAPITSADEWILNRRKLLTVRSALKELGAASSAAQALRDSFERMVEGKLDPTVMRGIADNIERLLSITQALRQQ